MGKPIESDYKVTASMARAALQEAESRGLAGYSWKVGGGVFTREVVLGMFFKLLENDLDNEFIRSLFAMRIREEFGVDGKKAPRKTPKTPRANAAQKPWPDRC